MRQHYKQPKNPNSDSDSATLSGDMFVLASKAYHNRDYKSAATLFAYACENADLGSFINSLAHSKTTLATNLRNKRYINNKIISERVLAALEEEIKSAGPIKPEQARKMVTKIKSLATQTDDETGSLEIEYEESKPEACETCGEFGCICTEEPEEMESVELSADHNSLIAAVKQALVTLKVRANEWEVKHFATVLLTFFPDLVLQGDRDSDIGFLVNRVLNRLHSLDTRILEKLRVLLEPLVPQH